MSEKHSPLLEMADCPFCGSAIKHITCLAKSFAPPRVYHEWHHEDFNADCPIRRHGKIVASASDDAGSQEYEVRSWNTRSVNALPELVAALRSARTWLLMLSDSHSINNVLERVDAALSKVKG